MTKQMSKNGAKGAVRVEEDALGDVEVPSEHLWGAQSQLARRRKPFSSMATVRRGVELATFSSKRACLALSRPHAFERI